MSFFELVVIICDPGLGKTVLTRALGEQPGRHHFRAGTFIRSPNPAPSTTSGERIVIDGLDEITPAAPGSVVEAAPKQLSRVWHRCARDGPDLPHMGPDMGLRGGGHGSADVPR